MASRLIAADIGGTNGRLQLWALENGALQLELAHTFRMAEFTGLGAMLTAFIDMATEALWRTALCSLSDSVGAVVLAICGPVWESGRMNDPNNMLNADGSRWPFQSAHALEEDCGFKPGSLLFINDFEAIGYALAALHSDSTTTGAECKLDQGESLQSLHSAPVISAAPIACIGAGTGLGNCFCCPFERDDGRGGKAVAHGVFCSEGGMTDTFSPRTEEEWGLKKWLMAKHGEYVEIERIVSGPGLADVARYIASTVDDTSGAAAAVVAELDATEPDAQAAVVSRHALSADGQGVAHDVCWRALTIFLRTYGREVGAAAQRFMSFGGLYIAGGILPKVLNEETKAIFVGAFLDQGPKMSETVSKVPLTLITSEDSGLKGALFKALTVLSSSAQ